MHNNGTGERSGGIESDSSPAGSIDRTISPIDVDDTDPPDVVISPPSTIKSISGLGSAFRQVKRSQPTVSSGQRKSTDSDGSSKSTKGEKKEKHVWRPY